jgi:hypothetical protein
MAVFDTHKAYTAFKEAGFTDTQAQALIDQGREGSDALATKGDLDALARATRADLDVLAQVTKADFDALAQATKADLRELEHRMTIRLGAMLFAVAGLQVVIIGILLALFNGS